jgi:hypothetical protein
MLVVWVALLAAMSVTRQAELEATMGPSYAERVEIASRGQFEEVPGMRPLARIYRTRGVGEPDRE